MDGWLKVLAAKPEKPEFHPWAYLMQKENRLFANCSVTFTHTLWHKCTSVLHSPCPINKQTDKCEMVTSVFALMLSYTLFKYAHAHYTGCHGRVNQVFHFLQHLQSCQINTHAGSMCLSWLELTQYICEDHVG